MTPTPVNFVRGLYSKYLENKDTYDTDGTVFWCTDRPAVFGNGTKIDLSDIDIISIEEINNLFN